MPYPPLEERPVNATVPALFSVGSEKLMRFSVNPIAVLTVVAVVAMAVSAPPEPVKIPFPVEVLPPKATMLLSRLTRHAARQIGVANNRDPVAMHDFARHD